MHTHANMHAYMHTPSKPAIALSSGKHFLRKHSFKQNCQLFQCQDLSAIFTFPVLVWRTVALVVSAMAATLCLVPGCGPALEPARTGEDSGHHRLRRGGSPLWPWGRWPARGSINGRNRGSELEPKMTKRRETGRGPGGRHPAGPARACPRQVNNSAGDLDGKRQGWLPADSTPVQRRAGRVLGGGVRLLRGWGHPHPWRPW